MKSKRANTFAFANAFSCLRKEREKFFYIQKLNEKKKVMQKTIEPTSSGDSNRVLERARVGPYYRVSSSSGRVAGTASDSP